MHRGRLLTGEFRQLHSLGTGSCAGVFVHVQVLESELPADLRKVAEHVVDGDYLVGRN
ncbi:hypothetical protein [Pseudoclavibacter sp. VKM Ac-2867]|uniref:hypothetical protein n=1 Tax=Pseudoclavibacter sp. VKM Ac-2867 TaxID=2783829 RepID=UPI00188AAB00|nr:hypothetical protein [Pseudoclavibacter sp. VKM Ac-2867]MBF4460510.1 hypothetical protein [Pseudoclavibacter sp. VKM Ac-2867]